MEFRNQAYVNQQIKEFFEQFRETIRGYGDTKLEERRREEDVAYRDKYLDSQTDPLHEQKKGAAELLLTGGELSDDQADMFGLRTKDERMAGRLRTRFLEGVEQAGPGSPEMAGFARGQGLSKDPVAPRVGAAPKGSPDWISAWSHVATKHGVPGNVTPQQVAAEDPQKAAKMTADVAAYLDEGRTVGLEGDRSLAASRRFDVPKNEDGTPMSAADWETQKTGIRAEAEKDVLSYGEQVRLNSKIQYLQIEGIVNGEKKAIQALIEIADNFGRDEYIQQAKEALGTLTAAMDPEVRRETSIDALVLLGQSLDAQIAAATSDRERAVLQERAEFLVNKAKQLSKEE